MDAPIIPDLSAKSAGEIAEMLAGLGLATAHPIDNFITEHPALLDIKSQVRTLSLPLWHEQIVLINGPSGSGKELIARGLHGTPPITSPFIAVNLAALPESLATSLLQGHRAGTFSSANTDREGIFAAASTLDADRKSGRTKGTVFLDEIGDMPLQQQAILLRILEQREVLPIGADRPVKINCRIIAATNKDLDAEVQAGRFRDDLYARLAEVVLRIPPWSERTADVALLLTHYNLPADVVLNADRLYRHGVRYIRAVATHYRLTGHIKNNP
jgi:DNA-binding NtrC family response regulator